MRGRKWGRQDCGGSRSSGSTGPTPRSAAAESFFLGASGCVTCAFRGSGYDRRRVIDSLRRAVPAALVEDVLIDGRSWDVTE